MVPMIPGPVPGRALLQRVIWRVWEFNQHARSEESYQLGAIVLQLLAARKWPSRNTPRVTTDLKEALDLATIKTFGFRFDTWCARNEMHKNRIREELRRLIPDYDPYADPREKPAP